VLITRPLEDSGRTAELVAARGFVPLVAPFMTVRLLNPALPSRVQAVLVTSGNALGCLLPMDVKLLAVGDTTAAKARAAGFRHVETAGRDAAALVSLAGRVARPADGPLLLLCGAGQGWAPAAELRARGFSVIRRVTYSAQPVRRFPAEAGAALRDSVLYAALFLSGETAAAFVRTLPQSVVPALTNVIAVPIGKIAADALRHLPWREVRLARDPTLDGVLAQL
jgi:uroporphyrinogen-III synthase